MASEPETGLVSIKTVPLPSSASVRLLPTSTLAAWGSVYARQVRAPWAGVLDHGNLLFSPTTVTHLTAGAVSGALARCVTAPISLSKTRFQITQQCSVAGATEASALKASLKELAAAEGLPGLWKGNTTAVARMIPFMGIRFGVFEEIKLALTLPDESGAVVSTGLAPPSPFGPVEKFAAGSIAGLTAVLCTYPLDLIKVSQMVAPRGHPLGSFSSAIALHVTAAMHPHRPRAALTRATIRGMFRGLLPTCIGIVLHDGAAFLVFETAKEVWIASELTRATSVAELAFGQHFVFGALAGMAARSISLPFDVVRKRLMAQPLLEAMGKPQPLR